MPPALDRVLRSVANRRLRYTALFPEAGSNIDEDVVFQNLWDIVRYVPRATEIALLAPFPSDWLAEGTLPSTTAMRRVAGFEMVGVYLSLLALPLALMRWRARLDLWILILLCLQMLVGYALVVANVGTLYRMRYPYIMMLVALGLAGATSWWRTRRETVPRARD